MTKQMDLEALRSRIEAADPTPMLRAQATQLVFGTGNPDAELLFVGEAPGKNEDLQGVPFIGAAGKFLDEMLVSIQLDRATVYITNIVKYRPPKNRDPSATEKAAFLPYLMEQIAIIRPRLVILLGRHSMKCFLPELIIGQAHGTVHARGDTVFLPLYHPAAALYNGSLRATLLADFARIPAILDQMKQAVINDQKEVTHA